MNFAEALLREWGIDPHNVLTLDIKGRPLQPTIVTMTLLADDRKTQTIKQYRLEPMP